MTKADSAKPGQIITFYSYKGGTGRSMAVANFAYWLAANYPALPRGVLVMDWDLEAPGLHRYFYESADRPENVDRPGVINYFDKLQKRLGSASLYNKLSGEEGWRTLSKQFPLDDFLIRKVVPGVDFIKAGNYDAQYAELISTFNWVEFYHNYGAVFPAFRDFLMQSYDFCLIDSRTGFNDVSGICTMLLPEKMVTVFTPNSQNIKGALDLMGRAVDYRLSSSDQRTLSIFPLPSRIENAETKLKEKWQKDYRHDFEMKFRSIYKLDKCDLTKYFDDVQLPHVSLYSYGEEIAVKRETRSVVGSLRRAYELFFEKLVGLKFAWDKKEEAAAVSQEKTVTPVSPEAVVVEVGDYPFEEKQYDSDIYISYSHRDNIAFVAEAGWIENFQTALEARLEQLLGYGANVWRDSKLRGSDSFSDMILQRLGHANVFIAVISPGYVNSPWCVQELNEFYRLKGSQDSARIFAVVKTPVPREDFPPLLGDSLGYDFYEFEDGKRLREFVGRTDDRKFWERLDDLAQDIASFFNKQRRAAAGLPATEPEASPSAIYLAETTSDLEMQHERVKRELVERGYVVLPDKRLPPDGKALREAISLYLRRSRLSIHLIGDSYGAIPKGDRISTVEIQNELAAERSTDPAFARIIWMPIGILPADKRQEEFLNRLKADPAAQIGAELLETSLENLKELVQRKLLREPAKAQASELIRIYLIYDHVDLEQTQPIENYLFGAGFEVIRPAFEETSDEIMRDHKDNLLLCDAVLIYHGQSSSFWLRSKLTDLRKALGWGRAHPFLATAVLLGNPPTEDKLSFRTREAMTISFGDFDPELLAPFLAEIRTQSKQRAT